MSEPRSYLRGWMGYFGLAAQCKLFDRLDKLLTAAGRRDQVQNLHGAK